MTPIDRQQPIWYYRLGDQTLGPVAWTEIEQLLQDTVNAADLLVARGGDPGWITAAEAMEQFPELAPKETAPAAVPAAEPEDVGWLLEEEEEEEPTPRVEEPWTPTAPSPRPAPVVDRRPQGRTPEPGLGKWLGQAWDMVIGDIWPWVGAMLLMMLVGGVTLGIAGPPLLVGIYMMALKRWRGEALGASDVFAGFSRFWSAWGVSLLMMLAALVVFLPSILVLAVMSMNVNSSDGNQAVAVLVAHVVQAVSYLALLGIQTVFFYVWVLVAEGSSAWDAVTGSWAKVREEFLSYLGIYLVLSILSNIGTYLCLVGAFVTWPLLPCATVAAYRWHFRNERGVAA